MKMIEIAPYTYINPKAVLAVYLAKRGDHEGETVILLAGRGHTVPLYVTDRTVDSVIELIECDGKTRQG